LSVTSLLKSRRISNIRQMLKSSPIPVGVETKVLASPFCEIETTPYGNRVTMNPECMHKGVVVRVGG